MSKRKPVIGSLLALGLAGCAGTGRIPPPPPSPADGTPGANPESAAGGAQAAGRSLSDRVLLPANVAPPAIRSGAIAGPDPEWVAFLASDPIIASVEARDPAIQDRMSWWIDFWQGRSRDGFMRGLSRMGRYEEMVRAEVADRGLPASLLYLPLIEANYYPTAVSPVGAGGLWQFMPATARWLGIGVDPIIDDRFDPATATPVALDYIVDLHEQFESWFLTLAAYNGGPGRLDRIIRRHGGGGELDDAMFLRIRDALPRETRDFIPKFLAAVRMASNPEHFGLADYVRQTPPRSVTVEVEGAATLDVIAQVAGVEVDEVRVRNPQLVREITAPAGSTAVRLPAGVSPAAFAERLALIPPHRRVTTHTVVAGETLTHIARYYKVSVAELRRANPAVEPRRMQIGTVLTVPTGLGSN